MNVDANKVIEELTKQNAMQNLELIKFRAAFSELREENERLKKELENAKDTK